jgi:hypothetical protein
MSVTERREQTLKVSTDPPGAWIWKEHHGAWNLVGRAPVDLKVGYDLKTSRFNRWMWLWPGIAGAGTAGSAIGWAVLKEMNDFPIWQTLFGVFAYLGAFALAPGLITCIVGEAVPRKESPIPEEIMLGVSLTGHAPERFPLVIPDPVGRPHLRLRAVPLRPAPGSPPSPDVPAPPPAD